MTDPGNQLQWNHYKFWSEVRQGKLWAVVLQATWKAGRFEWEFVVRDTFLTIVATGRADAREEAIQMAEYAVLTEGL